MNNFLASLNPRQKKIFYVTVFIVVLALFDRLLVGPTTVKLHMLDEAIENEENSIKRDLRFLAYKDRIIKESKLFDAYYSNTVPNENDVMAAFLDKLNKMVGDSGLAVIKNNRANDQKDQDKEDKDFFVYNADLECSGSLEGVAKLLYAIDTSPDFFKILKLNLSMKKNGDVEEIKATMTVAKYIINSAAAPSTAPSVAKTSSKSSPAEKTAK